METINGYEIVAEAIIPNGERVILGKKIAYHYVSFVTAYCAARNTNPREWYWGNYFEGKEGQPIRINELRRMAQDDFVNRAFTERG